MSNDIAPRKQPGKMKLALLALAVWMAGCAAAQTREAPRQPANPDIRNIAPTPSLVPSMAGVAYDELWIIEQPANDGAPEAAPLAGGGGALLTQRGQNFLFCPLTHTQIDANVVGCIATVDVSQTFKNPNRGPADATYTFPLPANAAVSDFLMSIGSRHIRGIIRPHREAAEIYRQARQQGYRAALLVEQSPHLFTQSIGSLEPGKPVDIQLQYVEPLAMKDGNFVMRLPLSLRTRANPPPIERNGGNVAVHVTLNPGSAIARITCPSHSMEIHQNDALHATASLLPSATIPNRDLELHYRVSGNPFSASLFPQTTCDGGYAALTIALPPGDAKPRALDAIIALNLADSSNLETARQAAKELIHTLDPVDRVQLLDGQTDAPPTSISPAPLPQIQQRIDAWPVLFNLSHPSVRTAIDHLGPSATLFVITDAKPSLEFLSRSQFKGDLAVVCIDPNVDRRSVFAIARGGRGPTVFIKPGGGRDLLHGTINQLRAPALRNFKIDWGSAKIETLSPGIGSTLHAGQAQLVIGRFKGPAPVSVSLSGRMSDGREIHQTVTATPMPTPGALENLWGRMSIARLLLDKPDQPPLALEKQIEQTAMECGLVSPFTSYLCVDATASHRP